MIIGDRDSVVGNYWAVGARHLARGQLVVHGLDPQRVDPAEGEANVVLNQAETSNPSHSDDRARPGLLLASGSRLCDSRN